MKPARHSKKLKQPKNDLVKKTTSSKKYLGEVRNWTIGMRIADNSATYSSRQLWKKRTTSRKHSFEKYWLASLNGRPKDTRRWSKEYHWPFVHQSRGIKGYLYEKGKQRELSINGEPKNTSGCQSPGVGDLKPWPLKPESETETNSQENMKNKNLTTWRQNMSTGLRRRDSEESRLTHANKKFCPLTFYFSVAQRR